MNAENNPNGELIVYQGQGLDEPVQVRLEGETVWLSQKLMAELYGTTVANVNQHISSIYEDEELSPEATIKKYLIVQTEGSRQVKRQIDHYNLEMIIAVGFRVRSRRGAQFRKWANDRISEYLVKGFTMDDERLKDPGGWDYFDELQNKLLFAVTHHTATELVVERADPKSPNMALMSATNNLMTLAASRRQKKPTPTTWSSWSRLKTAEKSGGRGMMNHQPAPRRRRAK